ncbi:MAG: iron-sulfur cluster assembly protein [Candidatus Aenigmatarchaeota archaeon]
MVEINKIFKALDKVVDPEIGIPITEMKLIDNVKVKNSNVEITFHLTTPFCPPMLALRMANDIKQSVLSVGGVKKVKLKLQGPVVIPELKKQIEKL